MKSLGSDTNRFKLEWLPRTMAPLVAGPLSSVEQDELDEGLALFDEGKFWHAHEAWESL